MVNARERVQRLLDGHRTDIEETALHGITAGDRTLEGDIRELLDIAEAAEVVAAEVPAPESRGERLVRLMREHVTAAQVEADDAEALRSILQNIEEIRLTTADEVRDRPTVTSDAIRAAAYCRILALIDERRFVHVSTEPDRITEALAFGLGGYSFYWGSPCGPSSPACGYQEPHLHGFACDVGKCPCRTDEGRWRK